MATKKATKKKPAKKVTKKPSKKTAKKKVVKKAKIAKKPKKSARKPSAAFMAPMQPSAALAEVVGTKALPRTEVIKRIWTYIKKRNLQDPKNKRNIVADEALAKVFKGKRVVSMFEMTKLVNDQLTNVT